MKAERDAMGADEYHPISRKGSNLTEAGGIGYTVVDSLDTMLLMGLDAEYLRARDWVEHKLTFERDAEFNTFEVRFFGPCAAYCTAQCDLTHFFDRFADYNPRARWPSFRLPPLWRRLALPEACARSRGPHASGVRYPFWTPLPSG